MAEPAVSLADASTAEAFRLNALRALERKVLWILDATAAACLAALSDSRTN